ncbi:hypothetical protein EJ08DRAFT_728968 [Tothia fuscella]|uniref:Pre-mRNA-splicing factor 38B n=1 Tax=Tothia fuscella TaxID=1048955 RepID=A0A9P4P1E5_9PEZI|nr:hypothetical protein EJ08DRAFT_728968 [Tothia fuscella]
MSGEELTDEYVAKLLEEDAKKACKNYALGLGGFLPKRPTTNAPRANTRFLHNILKETKNHNQALLAKEAEEAKARLRAFRTREREQEDARRNGRDRRRGRDEDREYRSKRRRVDVLASDRNRLSPPRESERHIEDSPERNQERQRRKRAYDDSEEELDRKSHHRSTGRHQRRRTDYSDDSDASSARDTRRHHKGRRDRSGGHSTEEGRDDDRRKYRHLSRHHKRKSHRDRSASRSRDRDIDRDRSVRKRRRRDSPSPRSRSASPRRDRRSGAKRREHPNTTDATPRPRSPKQEKLVESDSDPLEDIVGPLPPRPSKIKVRGRGAFSASAMDTHFSSTYDPSADVEMNPNEDGDWEQALEALRDRQRFKQAHGDRLRAAGFSEVEVKKWEKGGEKTEEDVRWAKKGEGREWDRGKVVGDDGHVDIKAEWGRLKDT